jgi:acyl-CoA thioesterase FadM
VRPYRVRFEEATANETMRTAIYLAWAADIAWQHSTLLGFGRDWYSRGLFWLVRAVRLDVLRPIRTYQVFVTTQVPGYRRIAARRHSEVLDASGELLAASRSIGS